MIDVMVIVHLINKVFFCEMVAKKHSREHSRGSASRKHLDLRLQPRIWCTMNCDICRQKIDICIMCVA